MKDSSGLSKRTSRRAFIKTLGLGAAAAVAAACAPAAPSPTPAPAKPAATTAPPAPAPTTAPAAAPTAAPKPAATTAPAPAPTVAATTAAAAKPAGGAFPTKTIEIIVPFNPGGGFDTLNRQMATILQQDFGQPVVVKNVTGGGQRIAARTFQQAPADGHTIAYFDDAGLYAATLVQPPEGFDLNSWIWLPALEARDSTVYVAAKSPFKTVKELIDADAKGQRLRFAQNGLGGGYLPMCVVFTQSVGMKNAALIGGYTGTADMIPALIRGDVDVLVLSELSGPLKFVQSGDIKPLVTLGRSRLKALPDLPTAADEKLPNVDQLASLAATYGPILRQETAPDRVAILEAAYAKALKSPVFVDWAKKVGKEEQLLTMSGKELTTLKKGSYSVLQKYAAEFKKYQ